MSNKYIRRNFGEVTAEKITADSYDGYENVCAYCLDTLLFVDERLEEEAYSWSRYRCDDMDDGYCMNEQCCCPHMRKIGYICVGEQRAYPLVGDYKITDEVGRIYFMTAERFDKKFKAVEDNGISSTTIYKVYGCDTEGKLFVDSEFMDIRNACRYAVSKSGKINYGPPEVRKYVYEYNAFKEEVSCDVERLSEEQIRSFANN